MTLGDELPDFDPATVWLHAAPASPPRAITLVHFWSNRCPLCHEGSHAIRKWQERFAGRGLYTIAIFQPRDDKPVDRAMIERDARGPMHIAYPCAIDEGRALARRFENEFPPGYFVFDAGRRLRHRQMGNADLLRIEALIERLAQARDDATA